eukprot:6470126-Heterocapsa_arctica.AAC.1
MAPGQGLGSGRPHPGSPSSRRYTVNREGLRNRRDLSAQHRQPGEGPGSLRSRPGLCLYRRPL